MKVSIATSIATIFVGLVWAIPRPKDSDIIANSLEGNSFPLPTSQQLFLLLWPHPISLTWARPTDNSPSQDEDGGQRPDLPSMLDQEAPNRPQSGKHVRAAKDQLSKESTPDYTKLDPDRPFLMIPVLIPYGDNSATPVRGSATATLAFIIALAAAMMLLQ